MTAPLLSLAHFTAIDADPVALIEAAAAAGFNAVGLRIVAPPGASPAAPVLKDAALRRRIRQRLADTNLTVLDTEAVWLLPETEVAALVPVLDASTQLGARYLVVSGNDPDRGRTVENFARLCEGAHARHLRVMLEFLPYTHIRSLAEAHDILVDAAPVNAGILVDALHLSRSGGSPADLASYDPALFSYMHLCDAPARPPAFEDLRAEARGGRLYPGEGGLWLDAFVSAFPADAAVAVEAPCASTAALPPAVLAQLAGNACRAVLASAGRIR